MAEPLRPDRASPADGKAASSRRTIDLVPTHGEMLKAAELIDVSGASALTLTDRRIYNMLLHAAHGPALGQPGARFEIPLSDLRDAHDSNDRLGDTIERLMRTIVVIQRPDGRVTRVALLGENDLSSAERRRGTLTYAISPSLAELLGDSHTFAKLELHVLRAFTSKYAFSLYEAVARRWRLTHVISEAFDLEGFRDLLGVPDGKLTAFGNLNAFAIKPAMAEVNALAQFGVQITPTKTGRRVTGVVLHWWEKELYERKAAFAALNRHGGAREDPEDGAA